MSDSAFKKHNVVFCCRLASRGNQLNCCAYIRFANHTNILRQLALTLNPLSVVGAAYPIIFFCCPMESVAPSSMKMLGPLKEVMYLPMGCLGLDKNVSDSVFSSVKNFCKLRKKVSSSCRMTIPANWSASCLYNRHRLSRNRDKPSLSVWYSL